MPIGEDMAQRGAFREVAGARDLAIGDGNVLGVGELEPDGATDRPCVCAADVPGANYPLATASLLLSTANCHPSIAGGLQRRRHSPNTA